MKSFMDEEFLLKTPAAQDLYHNYAETMPIIDYHCHINPRDIATDLAYDNLAEPWLCGDHYKWRIMRACGVPERLITGDADPYERFLAFATCLPRAIGNPVYHWTHLELKRYFDCDLPLCAETAPEIWNIGREKLRGGLTVRKIIAMSNVTGIATTDDPLDSLEWHRAIAADKDFSVTVRPAWRPDKLLNIAKPDFAEYIKGFGSPADIEELRAAIVSRLDYFASHGCTSSDHGLESLVYAPAGDGKLSEILKRASAGMSVSADDADCFRYSLMCFLGREYARRGWVMEIHYGAARNNNSARFNALGPDTGFDCIAPSINVSGLPRFLDELYSAGELPKTVLFSLSPGDNAMINTLAGCFQREGVRGLVQQGSAWWFNDSLPGMEAQIMSMASIAPLGNFLGMVTDSRSFLSYTRHEYFRRVLCNLLGGLVDNGEYPADMTALGAVVQDICYNNTYNYFNYGK